VHGTFVTANPASVRGAPAGTAGTLVYAMDLGQDRVSWYAFDPATRALTNGTSGPGGVGNFVQTSPGAGPRHMVMTPLLGGGFVAHVICEMGNTIESFAVDDATGALGPRLGIVSTLPGGPTIISAADDDDGNSPSILAKAAEIVASADGLFIYVSNRGFPNAGYNSVCVLGVDPAGGALVHLEARESGGAFPRGLALVGAGGSTLLAGGQDSDDVEAFAVNAASGLLTPAARTTATGKIVNPVCFAEN